MRNLPRSPLLPLFLLVASSSLGACSGSKTYEEQQKDYQQCLTTQNAILRGPTAQTQGAPARVVSPELLVAEPHQQTEVLRQAMRTEMQATLDAARASRIATLRCESMRPRREEEGMMASAGGDASNASPSPSGASQVSGTNNQVSGVDEADFVKNDNKFIYVANGSRFRVIEAWPAATMHEIASVAVPGTAKKLFVEGNRAVVYSAVTPAWQGGDANGRTSSGAAPSGRSGSSECTHGYDCTFQGDGTDTAISVFDVTDRAAPRLLRTIHASSSLLSARRVGNAVHTVLSAEPFAASSVWTSYPTAADMSTEQGVAAAYDALARENTRRIDSFSAEDTLPTLDLGGGAAPPSIVYQSQLPDGAAFTSLLSIDLLSDEAKAVTVISRPGAVYASAGALYMAVPHQRGGSYGWYGGQDGLSELSTIHKFSIGAAPSATGYVGSGVVKGRVLNQFAMDEKDGHLRIATTTGHVPSPDVHSTISVLGDQGGHLVETGRLDGIAKTEDIRSVRFDGDRGYVVTFKKTDPLFVFDLANPAAPRMLGELKIPGFSTYMHMMDATHLLTIGYDAADQGSFAYFTGVLLQIFDVSDPTNPTLTHKEVIGTRGSSSEALTNHLAFTYFAPKNLLALPMTVCEGGGTQGNYGTEMTFSGLMVYDVTASAGFSLKGKVAHPNAEVQDPYGTGYRYDSQGCSNWWTNASSEVRRSIVMDDWVFSVSNRRIKANALGALGTDVVEVGIE